MAVEFVSMLQGLLHKIKDLGINMVLLGFAFPVCKDLFSGTLESTTYGLFWWSLIHLHIFVQIIQTPVSAETMKLSSKEEQVSHP